MLGGSNVTQETAHSPVIEARGISKHFGAVTALEDVNLKLFRGEVVGDLFRRQTIMGFAFDVEILYLALKRGLRVKEVPVTWINSPRSKVDPVRDSLRMARDMIGIRFKNLLGLYR